MSSVAGAAGLHPQWIVPDWPAPAGVRAFITTRAGGVSEGIYGVPSSGRDGMNLGRSSGDDPHRVAVNRARLRAALPAEPVWLSQVHGAEVVDAGRISAGAAADAAIATLRRVVCVVTVADCMPVFICDAAARAVGVAHAGWRGLAGGVLQRTVALLRERLADPNATVHAYLGPAIGPGRFEVGAEVLDALSRLLPHAANAFRQGQPGKYLADLPALAAQALQQVGVESIHGGGRCTYSDPERFYSFRRDRETGRHAALIWLD